MKPVDVILPTYLPTDDCVAMTVRFLDSLYQHAPRARVIWVDNGSGERGLSVLDWLELHGAGRFLTLPQPDNLGFPRAVNIGLRASTAPYVLIANNDVVVHAGAVQALQDVLDLQPATAVAAPVSTSGWQAWPNLARHLGVVGIGLLAGMLTHEQRAAWLCETFGASSERASRVAFFFVMIPRPALERVGLLDEGYGMGFAEDDDWCERARRADLEVRLALGAFVVHEHRATWRAFMPEAELEALQQQNAERLEQRIRDGFQ